MNNPTPLITLAVSTWNHERYVSEAVRAALAQTYSPLEIIFSDDASGDDTFRVIEDEIRNYRGDHIVRLNRNHRNLGVGAHNDLLMGMARGEIVVLSAGDDIDEPERVSGIAEVWLADRENIAAVASYARVTNDSGRDSEIIPPFGHGDNIDAVAIAATGEAILGATLAVRRNLIDVFGPQARDEPSIEDLVLSLRAALVGAIIVIPTPLVRYRKHGESLQGSASGLAPNAVAHIAGLQRWLASLLGARRQQMRDLDRALAGGWIDPAAHHNFTVSISSHYKTAQHEWSLVQGNWTAIMRTVADAFLLRISPAAAIKMFLFSRWPSLWFRLRALKERSKT